MKKLFIYYYVEEIDNYKSISYEDAVEKDLLFYMDNDYFFFRRNRYSCNLELISTGFNSRTDPLLEIVLENKKTYMILEDLYNENNY